MIAQQFIILVALENWLFCGFVAASIHVVPAAALSIRPHGETRWKKAAYAANVLYSILIWGGCTQLEGLEEERILRPQLHQYLLSKFRTRRQHLNKYSTFSALVVASK